MRRVLERFRPVPTPDDPHFDEARDRPRRFTADLQAWHDALAATPLGERYWIWGGLLLGWAREGAPLEHDSMDADFAMKREDLVYMPAADAALRAAHFEPRYLFRNNARTATELTYTRHGARFELFIVDRVGERLSYHVYGTRPGTDDQWTQCVGYVPDQPLEHCRLAGRRWSKPVDHDTALRTHYGDWRTPRPDWWYMDDLAIEERVPYEIPLDDFNWSGPLPDLGTG